jgi:hypothetical protein
MRPTNDGAFMSEHRASLTSCCDAQIESTPSCGQFGPVTSRSGEALAFTKASMYEVAVGHQASRTTFMGT